MSLYHLFSIQGSTNKIQSQNFCPPTWEDKMSKRRTRRTNHPKGGRPPKRRTLVIHAPFSCNIKTNVGKRFFSILQKHFPEEHELHHLFNKRTVKLSYSCMPAMKSIISSHNKKILCLNKVEAEPGCNCQKGVKACPLDGKCQTQSLVYRAEVAREDGVEKEYLGQTNITFKLRWNNHKSECKLPHKEKATCLSKYVWYLKRKEINFTINWSVASIASPYSRETGRCQLCTMERTLIALQDRGRGLNRRAEVLTRCWHKDKHLLTNWVEERPAPLGGQAGEAGGGLQFSMVMMVRGSLSKRT